MMPELHSYTSNTAKLLKHLDTLKDLQAGKVVPIMVHTMPTHKCQLACIHCCFENRKDKNLDIPWEDWQEGIIQFHELGVRALEFSGGGDPTMWPHINKGICFAKELGYHLGICTNGLGFDLIKYWDAFDWIRISLNTLDYVRNIELNYYYGYSSNSSISACYIWNNSSCENIEKVIQFTNEKKIVCRIAPDCTVSTKDINLQLEQIRKILQKFLDNEYVILSDFNVDTERKSNKCFIHMIKPCLYTDGNVYVCPSAELAIENDRQIQAKTKVCDYKTIFEYYRSPEALKFKELDCSFCKYVKQQELLEEVLRETKFNEFA